MEIVKIFHNNNYTFLTKHICMWCYSIIYIINSDETTKNGSSNWVIIGMMRTFWRCEPSVPNQSKNYWIIQNSLSTNEETTSDDGNSVANERQATNG